MLKQCVRVAQSVQRLG